MGSFLPIILHIFSIVSQSLCFFLSLLLLWPLLPSSSSHFLPPYLLFPSLSFLILILSLALLSALFSLFAFLSPFLPFPSFSLFLRSLFSLHVMSQSCLLYPTLPEHPSLFSSLSFPALLLSLRHPPPPYCLCCLLSLPPLP